MLGLLMQATGLSQAKLFFAAFVLLLVVSLSVTVKMLWTANGELHEEKAQIESSLEAEKALSEAIREDAEEYARLNVELTKAIKTLRGKLSKSRADFKEMVRKYEDVRKWANSVVPDRLFDGDADSHGEVKTPD